MFKCKYVTCHNGVIGAKCGKVMLTFINGSWINATTGEVYTAVIDARNGKIKGFMFMPNSSVRFVYTIKRHLFYV